MIRIDKYTSIDRGADPTKEYYINQDGTYLSLTKAELEKLASDLKLLGIGAVSSSASNGFRPNVYISDDLEDLKRRYTPEQIKKMWEDCYPKSSEIIGTSRHHF
jgi:hypothetical protein